MPRFYIHFRVSDQIAKDDVGIELPSLEEARETALLSAREIVADDVKTNSKNPLQAVIIEGESGQDLLTISGRMSCPSHSKTNIASHDKITPGELARNGRSRHAGRLRARWRHRCNPQLTYCPAGRW